MPVKFSASFSLKFFSLIYILLIITENGFGQEEKFKALFIYNFTKYIEWPGISGNDFKITIIGNSKLVNELENIAAKKTVGQSTIKVVSVKSVTEVKNCQVIFISNSYIDALHELVDKAKSNNILLITESPNSCSQGASVNFVVNNGNIKFEISRSNIENAGLKVSASLLKLGIEVN
jgi:YfiR/HmsC-like